MVSTTVIEITYNGPELTLIEGDLDADGLEKEDVTIQKLLDAKVFVNSAQSTSSLDDGSITR